MEEKVRYEYLVVALPEGVFDKATRYTIELQRYGRMGWYLVSVSDGLAFFERTFKEVNVAQLEAIIRRVVAEQFGLDKK